MSGPSIAVRRRWREQVARFVASETFPALLGPSPLRPAARAVLVEELLHGHRSFPVRPIRAAARELIALEAEQAVFEDWTRARGLGPENREPDEWRLEFTTAVVEAVLDIDGVEVHQVAGACGTALVTGRRVSMVRSDGPGRVTLTRLRSPYDNLPREWAALGGDRRAPMGRSLARLGRRVLEALEGQPDACDACSQRERGCELNPEAFACRGGLHHEPHCLPRCPDCEDTGDNLRGVLPEVVETAQEKAKSEAREAAAWWRAEVRARMTGAVGGGLSTAVQLVPGVRHVMLEVDDLRHTVTIRVDGGDLDMVRQAAEDVVSATVFVVVERMALVPGTVRRVRGPVTLVDPSPE